MIRRTFVRNLLRFKYYDKTFIKNSSIVQKRYSDISNQNIETNTSVNIIPLLSNILTTRNFPVIQNDVTSATVSTSIFNKPVYCRSNNMFVGTNIFDRSYVINKNVRHYSDFRRFPGDEILQTNTGIFKSISESFPVEVIQNFMVSLHSQTGLPWWSVIILVTVSARLSVTLPLAFYQHYLAAKIENLKDGLKPFQMRLKRNLLMAAEHNKATELQIASEYAQTLRDHWKDTLYRENCHPVKIPVLSIIQIPLWLCLSIALRNMCYMLPISNAFAYETFMGLSTGGFGLMLDLTDRDHTCMLPLIFGIANVISFSIDRLNPRLNAENLKPVNKFFRNVYKGMIVCIIPVLAFVPSCIALFWTTNYVCILLQRLLLLSPKVRRLARVPKTKSELQNPYTALYNRLSNIVRFQRSSQKIAPLSSQQKKLIRQKTK